MQISQETHKSKTYFYCTSTMLQPMSVVDPGNWGRMLRLQHVPNNIGVVRELIYESVRRAEFPSRPSRPEVLFLCPSLQAAIKFRDSNQRMFDLIYEVQLEQASADFFEADWTLVQSPNGPVSAYEDLARRYWAPELQDMDSIEILTTSPIRILSAVS